jgi:hypothetical protein
VVRLERLARDKHSSLLRKSVNYGRKKFYSTGATADLLSQFGHKLERQNGRYDTQHNDIQHNDIQHNGIQHNDTQQGPML